MDWVRRNWPDVLIGFALLAVIVGIVATLINGGPMLRTGLNRNTSSSAAVGRSASTLPSGTTAAPTGEIVVTDDNNNPVSVATLPHESISHSAAQAQQGGDVAIVALPSVGSNAEPAREESAFGQRAITVEPTAPSANPSSVPLPTLTGSYRVSAGAFRDRANASNLAAQMRTLDYPVSIEERGNGLSVVYVGPYRNETEANQAERALRTAGYDAAVYQYRGAAEVPATSTSVDAQPATLPPATGELRQIPNNTSTLTGYPRKPYLQVGAYSPTQQAIIAQQRTQYEAQGYAVELRQGRFTRIVLGPFTLDQMPQVQNSLRAQGVEFFPVE